MRDLFHRRKELRQVALQASSVEELLEVVEATVGVMHKQWNEAISSFQEKFRLLSGLLLEHGKIHQIKKFVLDWFLFYTLITGIEISTLKSWKSILSIHLFDK